MTKLEALIDLRDKVQVGDGHATDLPFWKVWEPESEKGQLAYIAASSYNGSLDAAKALHDAVLPETWVELNINGKYAHCTLRYQDSGQTFAIDNQSDPARAWLLAILEALIAKEEGL